MTSAMRAMPITAPWPASVSPKDGHADPFGPRMRTRTRKRMSGAGKYLAFSWMHIHRSAGDDRFAAADGCLVGPRGGLVQQWVAELIVPVPDGVQRRCPGVAAYGIGRQAQPGGW